MEPYFLDGGENVRFSNKECFEESPAFIQLLEKHDVGGMHPAVLQGNSLKHSMKGKGLQNHCGVKQ